MTTIETSRPRGTSARFRPLSLSPLEQAVEDLVQSFARDPELAFNATSPSLLDDPVARVRLRVLLHDPDELVRWAAVRVLALMPPGPAITELLGRASRDVEPLVRGAAESALETVGSCPGTPGGAPA